MCWWYLMHTLHWSLTKLGHVDVSYVHPDILTFSKRLPEGRHCKITSALISQILFAVLPMLFSNGPKWLSLKCLFISCLKKNTKNLHAQNNLGKGNVFSKPPHPTPPQFWLQPFLVLRHRSQRWISGCLCKWKQSCPHLYAGSHF